MEKSMPARTVITIETPRTFRAWWARQYWLAVLPALSILLARYFYPDFLEDEAGKLIAVHRLFDPTFLSHDWLPAIHCEGVFHFTFTALIAPLWLIFKDALLVALTGRILIWALLLVSILRLARTIGIPRYSLTIGLALWLFRFQSLGAGEWIFGGIQSKCVAYALLLLALDAALQDKTLSSAFLCGFAIWVHVLVGGWGAMALGGAMLLSPRILGWRKPLAFSAIVTLFLAPVAGLFLRNPAHPASAVESLAADRIIVLFRYPHHLDPFFFHARTEIVLLIILAALATFAFHQLNSQFQASLLTSFLAILLLQFVAGLIARQFELFWFLKSGPFRVADVLVGLLAFLSIPALIARLWHRIPATRVPARMRPIWFAAFCFAFSPLLFVASAPVVLRDLATFTQSWSHLLRHQPTDWQQATRWILRNTPPSAVILAPPWKGAFWVEAGRAQVVNYEPAPHDAEFLLWHRRLSALNGGPFHFVGQKVIEELQENYPQLTPGTIQKVINDFGADYFLATRQYPEFQSRLVYRNNIYFLYKFAE